MNRDRLKLYFEWDIDSWSRALSLWQKSLEEKKKDKNLKAIELGSRQGGLSLMLASNYNFDVICTDLFSPIKTASPLHIKSGVEDKISYKAIDCTKIDFPDNSFDIVIFKSVIGALSSFEKQKQAITEMHRVLKPNGILLFAENANASFIHQVLRKYLVSWSSYWYYPTVSEFISYLAPFSSVEIKTTGFFATFFRNDILRRIFSFVDQKFDSIYSASSKYIIYGVAKK